MRTINNIMISDYFTSEEFGICQVQYFSSDNRIVGIKYYDNKEERILYTVIDCKDLIPIELTLDHLFDNKIMCKNDDVISLQVGWRSIPWLGYDRNMKLWYIMNNPSLCFKYVHEFQHLMKIVSVNNFEFMLNLYK